MNKLKTFILLLGIAILGVINILIYCNYHLYYQAEKLKDNDIRIQFLERAEKFYPLNDLVFYELGKTFYNLGLKNLDDSAKSDVLFRKSIQNFKRSIKINPASYFSHFYYAQSLQKMSFFYQPESDEFVEEFKKAASLAGENSQIFYETGNIFLSRWADLSDEERNFTVEILSKIVLGRNLERLQNIMEVWEMNVRDYAVISEILPEEPQIYRTYARFLGEKSLSQEVRKDILTRADLLTFEKAKRDYNIGDKAFFNFKLDQAIRHFKSCLDRLQKIRFYQKLIGQNQIDPEDFYRLKKNALLSLVKSIINKGEEFNKVEVFLRSYLSMELNKAEINDLDSYLKDRGLINENLSVAFDDLDLLSFQFLLYFKQSHYDKIVRSGRDFIQSFLRIPEEKKARYVEVLGYIGNSCDRLNYIYDAEDYYEQALRLDPDNLNILLGMLQIYKKQDNENKIKEINLRIEQIIIPKNEQYKNITIKKRRSFLSTLTLDGRRILLDIKFNKDWGEVKPLITVNFNGRVIWEDYIKEDSLSIPLQSKAGENSLQVVAVNQDVSVNEFFFR